MKKESISTIEGCPVNFLRLREHHASHPKWDPFMSSSGFLSSRLDLATNLYKRDLFAHYGCVNAIEFSQEGCLLASGGDDRRVLLWNLEKSISSKFQPIAMKEEHSSNIFCLGFDSQNRKIYSAGNDEQVIVHDIETGETLNAFMHEEAIYGVSVNPYIDTIFASAGEDGQVLLFDTRAPRTEEPLLLARSYDPFHAVQFHPVEPKFIVTANPKEGVVLWDVRKPRIPFLKYGDRKSPESSMCARFNSSGTQIIALRRRLPPILFNTQSTTPVCQFDADHYYNSCTMKSCCFAGSRDQYVLSGSDDFNLYMWRIPDPGSKIRFVSEAHLVLKGHRSIVNQVRFNPRSFTIASSGVEKIIKLWSTVPVPGSNGTLESRGNSHSMTRRVYTHEEYIGLVLDSGQNVSHDYSNGNTAEDPRMMAFFDSLVQREVEGWTTNTDFSDLNSSSTPTYSSSTVPSTDESDNDGAQSRPALGSSSTSTLPLRKRRILRTRKLRSNGRTRNLSFSPDHSDDEKPVAQARPSPGSDWILKLIAKKRAQLKAAKKKRKNGKKKQKNKSHKFIRCLTSNSSRPRPYMYRPDNYRSVAMTRSSTSIGGELLRRRHIVAPYTVMALGSYADSDEEEDSDQSLSDDGDKSVANDAKLTYKSNGNFAGESSSGPSQGTSKSSSSLKRKPTRIVSSESSSSSSDDDKKKIQFKGRKRILTQPSKNNGNSVKKSKLTKIVSEAVNSDFNKDNNLRNGATNGGVRKNKLRSDIDVSNSSNVPRATSDNICSEIVAVSLNCDINNISDAIPISGISIDKAGSVMFESSEPQTKENYVASEKPCPASVSDDHSSNKEKFSSKSSQSANKVSLRNRISIGTIDDSVFQKMKNCSNYNDNNGCQSSSNGIEDSPLLQSANSSLVSCSYKAERNSSLATPEKNGLTNYFSPSESQLYDGFSTYSLNSLSSPRPDSGACSFSEHTPDVSISLSEAHTPDSGISTISLISNFDCSISSNCANMTSDNKISNDKIDENSIKNMRKSGEISFKKVSDYKVRKYRSRSSSDDII